MPKYTVPVAFEVSAKSCAEAEAKVKQKLKAAKLRARVEEAYGHDIKFTMSSELKQIIEGEIQSNESDVSGYGTDLNYVLGSLQQMDDDTFMDNYGAIYEMHDERTDGGSDLEDVTAELEALIAKVGGSTICAHILPD